MGRLQLASFLRSRGATGERSFLISSPNFFWRLRLAFRAVALLADSDTRLWQKCSETSPVLRSHSCLAP